MEKEESTIMSKVIVSYLFVILLMGISITWILQKSFQKILTKVLIEEPIIKEINSNFIIISAGISITVMALALFIAYFLSKSLSNPVKELTKSVLKIKKGNLNYEINIKSNDEIGELAKSFDNMRLGLKDRNDLLNSLLKTFKGKFGNLATILVRKNVQELVKKNPRIKKILPKSLGISVKRASKRERERDARKNKIIK